MALDTSTDSFEDDDPPTQVGSDSAAAGASATEPLACVSCRARKLKCDRIKPACSRCVKIDGACVYPESRRKPTIKRRNVKELEARLAQVEVYLKEVSKNDALEAEVDAEVDADIEAVAGVDTESDSLQDPHTQFTDFDFANASASLNAEAPSAADFVPVGPIPNSTGIPNLSAADIGDNDSFLNEYQIMGLGLSEGLPPMEMMEELNRMYFAVQHFHIPVVHPGRYLQAFYGSPLKKPPMSLQYAIWASASYLNEKYGLYTDVFYMRARQYADADEMKGVGEHFITLFHAQAYAVLASFEAKNTLFTRASMTTARCVRLVHMMGLDKLDGENDDIVPTLTPPTSWVDLEERRRTFWGAYAIDCHASVSAGWPSLIQCDDISTKLPSSEEAFIAGREEETVFIEDVLRGAPYAGFASAIVALRTFKAVMLHCQRANVRARPDDFMNGTFWLRHRKLDNELTALFMFLPEKLRLPENLRDPSALQINFNLHSAVICLHHAAIEQAEAHGHNDVVKQSSIARLRATADEVANTIRLSSHNSAIFKSPLCDLAMYCASSVYVYCANERGSLTPIDRGNLQVIIQAMDAIGRKHEISRAFLHQACLDVERNNLASDIRLPNLKGYRNLFAEFSANDSLMTRIAVAKRFKPPRKLSDWVAPDKPFDRSGQLLLKDVQSELGSTLQGTDTAPGDEPATPCFRAMLGAVTRNVRPNRRRGANTVARPATVTATVGEDADIQIGGTKDRHNQKRRRFSPSPGPEEALNLERLCSNGMAGRGRGTAVGGNAFSPPRAMSGGSGSSTYHHYGRYPAQHANVSAVLPDRTGSSTSSSPMNHISTGTDTRTQSSQASPDVMGFAGLGNTAEENRVDLRSLQDRVATPIWDQAILDSMNDVPLPVNYGGDPWGIMNADLDWDAQVTTG